MTLHPLQAMVTYMEIHIWRQISSYSSKYLVREEKYAKMWTSNTEEFDEKMNVLLIQQSEM